MWSMLAALLVIIGLYRLLDVAELISALGRQAAQTEAWYANRRYYQIIAVISCVGIALASLVTTMMMIRDLSPPVQVAWVSGLLLMTLNAIQVISLHQIDAILLAGRGKINIYHAIEGGCVATIALKACTSRWRSPPDLHRVKTQSGGGP